MTPLSTLSLTTIGLAALAKHGIKSIESLGDCTPEQIRRMMPYCHAIITLAHYRQWHNQRYPSPALLMSRRRNR